MTQKFPNCQKFPACVWKFVIVHKDIIIFLSYNTKNFRIAHKFPDSNATLLPGFFSLCIQHPATDITTQRLNQPLVNYQPIYQIMLKLQLQDVLLCKLLINIKYIKKNTCFPIVHFIRMNIIFFIFIKQTYLKTCSRRVLE